MTKDSVTRFGHTFNQTKEKIIDFESRDPQWMKLSDTLPEEQQWFIENLIPANTSTIFAGSGGIGKSLVLLFFSAYTTTGLSFNFFGKHISLPKGSVILMSAEGKNEIHVLPKLIEMGADLQHIHVITSSIGIVSKKKRLLRLDNEMSILEQKIIELKNTDMPVKLIIIDPISYFTGDVKDHIQREVADFIHQLNDLADTHSITLLFNKHRRKQNGQQTFSSLANEVGGCMSWTNSPRQALGFIKHPKNKNMFLMGSIKSNVSAEKDISYPYTIESTFIKHGEKKIKTVKLVWGESVENINLDNASNKEIYEKTKSQVCSDLIFSHLKENGVSTRRSIIELCDRNDINERLRQRVICAMKKSQEIKEISGIGDIQYELSSDFDGFGKNKIK